MEVVMVCVRMGPTLSVNGEDDDTVSDIARCPYLRGCLCRNRSSSSVGKPRKGACFKQKCTLYHSCPYLRVSISTLKN